MTRRSGGYMPKTLTALRAAKVAERAAIALWDKDVPQNISKKRRYAIWEHSSRSEWNDGQRCPSFWPLERDLEPAATGPARPEQKMRKLGEKAAKPKPVAIRTEHTRAAQAAQRAGGAAM